MEIPDPQRFLGFLPGAERLADWASLAAYFSLLAAHSPRVRMLPLGASSEGRPLIALAVGRPQHLDALERLSAPATGPRTPRAPFGIVVRLGGIHAVESAAAQGSALLAHTLATSDVPTVQRVLARLVVILVPAVDPDGLDRVCAWTRGGGGPPPGGARRWADHDLNRDWILQTQPEVRAVAARVLHRYQPQVVMDMHEMWPDGPRMFLPPYAPPDEPHASRAVVTRAGRLGRAIARRLTAAGLAGVATGVLFDAYSPARGYPFYHGAVRILCETATAPPPGTARSGTVPRRRAGFDPREATGAQPLPWPGGPWDARDVLRYQEAATWACLDLVARSAPAWIRWQAEVLAESADAGRRPEAYHIPAVQSDPRALREVITTLRCGGLELRRDARGWTVPRAQPWGRWADALLSDAPYPTGGQAPYDVTAHLLPALAGVRALGPGAEIPAPPAPDPGPAWAADARGYARALRRLAAGEPVWRLEPGTRGGPPAGGFLSAEGAEHFPATDRRPLRPPWVALYAGWTAGDDAGWIRYLCRRFGVELAEAGDRLLQQHGLPDWVTHLVLPAIRGRELVHGGQLPYWPRSFRGGLGEAGVEALRAFVARGGHLVAIEDAAAWTEVALSLPLEASPPGPGDTVSPGSLVAVRLPALTFGVRADAPVWAMYRGRAVLHADAHATARFAAVPAPMGSGAGLDRLDGTAAVAEVPWGRGRCTLFAFSPFFRAQSWSTLPLFFNALLR